MTADEGARAARRALTVGMADANHREIADYLLLLPLGLLLWLLLSCLWGLPGLFRTVRAKAAAWELLEAAERRVDLTLLGFSAERPLVLRQQYGAEEPVGGDPGVDSSIRRTGLTLWGGALDMASFLLVDRVEHPAMAAIGGAKLVQGSVLELGAGLGLPSMVAALTEGFKPVVATDGSAAAVAAAAASVAENLSAAEVAAGVVRVERLRWGDQGTFPHTHSHSLFGRAGCRIAGASNVHACAAAAASLWQET